MTFEDLLVVEERVKILAYHLWEQAGRPEGRDLEFWDIAEAEECVRTLESPLYQRILDFHS